LLKKIYPVICHPSQEQCSTKSCISVFTNSTQSEINSLNDFDHVFKAMLHEAIFLATCNTTKVALQVARKNSLVTPHFATAIIVVLQVAINTVSNVSVSGVTVLVL